MVFETRNVYVVNFSFDENRRNEDMSGYQFVPRGWSEKVVSG